MEGGESARSEPTVNEETGSGGDGEIKREAYRGEKWIDVK